MNLAHTLFRTARRVPHAIAVIERDRVELSYEQLAVRVLELAGGLQAAGVRPGDSVGALMKNCAQYVELLYACWTLGACAIPMNSRLHPREVAYILDDAEARMCFVTDDADTAAIDVVRGRGPTRFIDVDGGDYRALLRSTPAALGEASNADDGAWLFYTSGTTGRPKGVVLTHRNLLAMSLNYLADVDHAVVGEHLLHAAPMSHGSGLYILPNVAAGATQLIPAARAFEVDEIMQILAYTPSTKFFAAPTMVMRLVEAYGEKGSAPEHLKALIYGGGPMYVADSVRALDVLGPRLVQIYGQGESPMTITVLTAAEHVLDHDGRRLERLGSVGRAQVGVEVSVRDESGRARAPGEIGEVCVRGDTVMAAYLNNPQATADALAGGWLHTGDLGRLDDAGYLTLVDRSKDLIISGGSNIYPREVEEVLLLHPAVKEAAVIGEPHPDWGEAVVAVLVREAGHIPDEKELDLFCLEHIARFKRPKRYIFVDELPKNATGKVLKRELRELIRRP
ncbi:MAG TPA: AMP-binding protein [Burkholderiaceae bacterium]|nr:AMP-binding protein [Burkholderiaceae bacterium]